MSLMSSLIIMVITIIIILVRVATATIVVFSGLSDCVIAAYMLCVVILRFKFQIFTFEWKCSNMFRYSKI